MSAIDWFDGISQWGNEALLGQSKSLLRGPCFSSISTFLSLGRLNTAQIEGKVMPMMYGMIYSFIPGSENFPRRDGCILNPRVHVEQLF